MNALLQDIRYALRMLRKSPGFTAVAMLTLALGIGANTAIFSVVNSTLLAPLPFRDSSQLVNLHAHATFFDFWNLGLSLPDINDIRSQSKSFSAVVPFEYATVDLIGRDAPRELDAAKVPADFFSMLGLKTIYGRTFLPSETQPGADREAILSGTLWRTQFGSDPRIVGTSITLNGEPYTVVGVMAEIPKVTFSPAMVDLWTPFAPTQSQLTTRGMHGIPTLARLKPGVTRRQAQAELNTIATRLAKAYPNDDKNWSFRADSLRADMTRNTRTPLLILLGAVGFVLLIACANVGNLFLSRGWARRREMAIRSTLGATRGRLIRQLLVESTLLALAGGACGLLMAWWGVAALRVEALAGTVSLVNKVAIDTRVLLFTLGVSILAGLLFGLAPAFLSSRHDLSTAMKESGAGSQTGASGSRHNPLRQILVVTEIALALVLVIGATLALRSFSRMLHVNLGFNTQSVLDMRLDFPAAKFKTSDDMFAYVRALTDRLRATPGVESASAAANGPLSSSHGEGMFSIEGVPENPKAQLMAEVSSVGPGYFQTLAIPLLRGHEFTAFDSGKSAPAMIVNHAFAERFFGGENPIGKRIFMGDEDAQHHKIWDEIVGEVGDVHDRNPRIAAGPTIYISFFNGDFTAGMLTGVDLLLRARANPEALISAAQSQVWALDKSQPISRVQTMRQRVAISVSSLRFQTMLLGIFGALGLLLAMVGIYGVISYSVTQRVHEIGIRMALGAEPAQVMRLILAQGLKLAFAGVVIGVIASLALTRLMSSLLFGVSATDPLTFAGVAILLTIVALLACYVPARRAMRVDPMVALRYE
ncbi:MAG: ABC transporter permease [Candidatus Acidiferrales bacterium]